MLSKTIAKNKTIVSCAVQARLTTDVSTLMSDAFADTRSAHFQSSERISSVLKTTNQSGAVIYVITFDGIMLEHFLSRPL